MARYKIIFQEEKEYEEQTPNTNRTYMDTTHEVSSSDPTVMAAVLRSIADSLSPKTKLSVYRGGIRTIRPSDEHD